MILVGGSGNTKTNTSHSSRLCRCAVTCYRYYVQGDTKKRELFKNPTKIEEIQEKKNY